MLDSWYLDAGFGNMLARPLFREKHSPDMSEAEATELVHEALKVRASLSHIDIPLHGSSDKDTP